MVGCFHGGREFELFRVERDDEFIEQLVRITGVWWSEHVVANVPSGTFNVV